MPTLATLAVLAVAALAGCGNYSNEDLEYMNAVPARADLDVTIPAALTPLREAELARLTHETVRAFNGALLFLEGADKIRTFQPTSRLPDGRIWGPFPMEDRPGWLWRFMVTRDPDVLDRFDYQFDVMPVGGTTWTTFIEGWFDPFNGVRKGVGHFTLKTDPLDAAGYPLDTNEKGELLKELIVDYSTAGFPVSVTMNMALYLRPATDRTAIASIRYHHELQESGAGSMEFAGTDSSTGYSISIVSRWMATGRGRADANVVTPDTGATGLTRTQCWNDQFEQTYNNTPWSDNPDVDNTGDPAQCPDFSTP